MTDPEPHARELFIPGTPCVSASPAWRLAGTRRYSNSIANELFRFLRKEPAMLLEEVAVRTAFFRLIDTTKNDPDGWTRQGMNQQFILRYSWRDRLRKSFRQKPMAVLPNSQ